MTRSTILLAATIAAPLFSGVCMAQTVMTPLATFGTGGWAAPGSSAYLNTGHTERGLSFNPVTGNLVLVSRAGGNHIRVLSGSTGADLGGLDPTGISGGTYSLNMVGVADDGAIYVGNLSTSATSNFKVYRWNDEASGMSTPPTVAYDAPSGVARTGDSFAVRGSGSGTRFAAAGSSASSTATNSNFVEGALDGTNASMAYLSIPGTNVNSNDYRLSITFVDATTVIGNQGAQALYTSFNGTTATVAAGIPLGGAAQRALDYAVIGGTPVLAVIDSNSSNVSVFEITNPATPILLATANATSGTLSSNANGTGSVTWGAISGNTATLYAMATNQGIQAFTVTVQPPASALGYGVGCGSPELSLSATGAPILPSTIQLSCDNIPTTAAIGAFAFGLTSIPSGLPIAGAPGCSQYLVPLAASTFVPLGATSVQLPQTYPNVPAFAGVKIVVQSAVIDGASTLTSNGLRLYLETF
ncbi:MAG: DUF4623 domain-containing protein [Planctomycetes bacterium]|nr:DUF4623 domain-containing protein [Planctomycetota bacterium]